MKTFFRAAAALVVTLGGIAPVAAQAYEPAFRPSEMTDTPAGPANEVMVLGSPHLSGLPESFEPEMVEPLVARLVE